MDPMYPLETGSTIRTPRKPVAKSMPYLPKDLDIKLEKWASDPVASLFQLKPSSKPIDSPIQTDG